MGPPTSRFLGAGCSESDSRLESPRPLWSSPKIRDKIQEDQTLVGTETLDTTSDLTGVRPL